MCVDKLLLYLFNVAPIHVSQSQDAKNAIEDDELPVPHRQDLQSLLIHG